MTIQPSGLMVSDGCPPWVRCDAMLTYHRSSLGPTLGAPPPSLAMHGAASVELRSHARTTPRNELSSYLLTSDAGCRGRLTKVSVSLDWKDKKDDVHAETGWIAIDD